MLTTEEIKERLNPVFEKNGTRKAILFGSIAKGVQQIGSDVDILVDSGLHGLDFFWLLEDVCSALGEQVDLIDVRQLKPNGDMKKNWQHGVIIYERTWDKGSAENSDTRGASGMRNRIVHGCGEVSMEIVWEEIQNDLPELKKELEEALNI